VNDNTAIFLSILAIVVGIVLAFTTTNGGMLGSSHQTYTSSGTTCASYNPTAPCKQFESAK
jgi:hypothetical protein